MSAHRSLAWVAEQSTLQMRTEDRLNGVVKLPTHVQRRKRSLCNDIIHRMVAEIVVDSTVGVSLHENGATRERMRGNRGSILVRF